MKKLGLALSLILCLTLLPFTSCKKESTAYAEYNIEVSLNGSELTGKEEVVFRNFTDNAFSELKFNLFGNAFRKGASYTPIADQYYNRAYYNGASYGGMAINSVKQGGKNLEFSIGGEDENILIVKLAKELFPREEVKVEIEFTLSLANVIARTGINDNTINLGNFYPIVCGISDNAFYECLYYSNGDPFFSDVGDYTVKISVDSKYLVASGGKQLSCEEKAGRKVYTFSQKKTRSFCMVLSEKFNVISDNSQGVEINYYYYSDATPEKSLEFAVKSLKLFSEIFGEYPYPTYSVVETEFIQGGMEYPGIVMISSDLEADAFREVIVHETAHQWWQTVVGNNEIEYGFLDEGLAEYSVVLFYENFSEYGLTRENMITSSERTYKVFCTVHDKLFGKVNTVMLRSLKDFESEYEYVNMAYIKPCIMYDYLRKSIGDERFFKALKRYYKEYSFLNTSPYDLVGVFEKIGADTNGFFISFFEGKVVI